MKKSLIIILAVCLTVFSIAGCGGSSQKETTTKSQGSGESQAQTQTPAAAPSASEAVSGYSFTYKGVQIFIGQNASVIDQLGEYKSFEETASCAFQGMDKQYFYGSFYITTGTDSSGEEVVTGFWFVDDTVETDEGLCVGDSVDKVEELFGADGFNGTNAYIYTKDLCKLIIIIEDDAVSSISYAYDN